MEIENTIYEHNPSKEEFQLMEFDYYGYSKEFYLNDLKRRANALNSSVEYEAVCDLQELSKIRKDDEAYDKYTKILDVEFADITNRLFNE